MGFAEHFRDSYTAQVLERKGTQHGSLVLFELSRCPLAMVACGIWQEAGVRLEPGDCWQVLAVQAQNGKVPQRPTKSRDL